MIENTKVDIVVIGGGPAGYSAAIRATQLGASVILVEKDKLGGTCLNRGCIPTKFFWEAVHFHKRMKRAADYGISVQSPEFSLAAFQEKKERLLDLQRKGLRRLVESHGVTIIEGSARFRGRHEIEAGTTFIQAGNVIICAGSTPAILPGLAPDHSRILDSDDMLNLTSAPASLLVVGGGAIGVEMATIYATLGTAIHLIDIAPRILPREDPMIAADVQKSLERLGVKIETGIDTDRVAQLVQSAEKVLAVTGRHPIVAPLNLEAAKIEFSPKGIPVNEHLETSVPGIYAAGDVTGRWYLAYTAQAEGVCAAENIMGHKNTPDFTALQRAVFSQPPAASVGVTEDPAAGLVAGTFPFGTNARSAILGERTGWLKVVADKATGTIKGGSIFGPHAEELITTISIAVKKNLTIDDLSRECFFHPSLSEAIHHAAEQIAGRSVELPKLK